MMTDDNGNPLPLTSHTLAPVPVAIGGKGLPDNITFRNDLPNAGEAAVFICKCNQPLLHSRERNCMA